MKYENDVENEEIENLIVQSITDSIIWKAKDIHKEIQAFSTASKVDL